MPRIQADYEQMRVWRRLLLTYLWLSVAICVFTAILFVQLGHNEDARLVGVAFFGLGMLGLAFARALRELEQPRWWHWAVGTLLITPAALYVLGLGSA